MLYKERRGAHEVEHFPRDGELRNCLFMRSRRKYAPRVECSTSWTALRSLFSEFIEKSFFSRLFLDASSVALPLLKMLQLWHE